MGQEYRVLAAEQGDRTDQHGNLSFWVKLDVDGEPEPVSALLVQKPTTPAPSGILFGRLESQTSKAGNAYFRFRKEQREGATAGTPPSSGSPGPEFWAQKDKRLARAGMTQAVVSSGLALEQANPEYVVTVNARVDVLLEDLEKRTPSPNNSSASEAPPTAGTGTSTPPPAATGGVPSAQASHGTSGPNFTSPDFAMALAACGFDNSNPETSWNALDAKGKEQVTGIYANLKSQGPKGDPSGGPVMPSTIADDDSIPF